MALKTLRQKTKLTQRELATRSGVNFRSLQDYEQGHKSLLSANGDTLLRLTSTLGCSLEELLLPIDFPGAPLHPSNTVPLSEILKQRFYCEKYRVFGRWISNGKNLAIFFHYNGKPYILPFNAYFTEKFLHPLCGSAVLQMEAKIEDILFGQNEWKE